MSKSVFILYYDLNRGTPEDLADKIEDLKRGVQKENPFAKITAITPLPATFSSPPSFIINFEER